MCITAKCSYSIKIDSTITLGKIEDRMTEVYKEKIRVENENFEF